jgi:hypothetical protein
MRSRKNRITCWSFFSELTVGLPPIDSIQVQQRPDVKLFSGVNSRSAWSDRPTSLRRQPQTSTAAASGFPVPAAWNCRRTGTPLCLIFGHRARAITAPAGHPGHAKAWRTPSFPAPGLTAFDYSGFAGRQGRPRKRVPPLRGRFHLDGHCWQPLKAPLRLLRPGAGKLWLFHSTDPPAETRNT